MKVGDERISVYGSKYTIIDYPNCNNVTIQWETGNTAVCQAVRVRDGHIKNPMQPTLAGVGYIGIGRFGSRNNRFYHVWSSIIIRCYSDKYREKFPTYEDVSMVEEWHNFQNFAEWASVQIGCNNDGWQLDKDILSKDCKVYAPHTCVFIPQELNKFLLHIENRYTTKNLPLGVRTVTNSNKYSAVISIRGKQKTIGCFYTKEEAYSAYKNAKESLARSLADEWKDQIDPRVYNALKSFKLQAPPDDED